MTTPTPDEPQRPPRAAPFFPTPSATSDETPNFVSVARRRIVRAGIAIVVIGFLLALVGAILLGQGRGPQESAGDFFHHVGKLTLLFGLLTLLIGFRWQPAKSKLGTRSFDSDFTRHRPTSVRDLLDELGPGEHGAGEEGHPFVLPGVASPGSSESATELAGAGRLQLGQEYSWRKPDRPVAVKILIAIMVLAAAGCTMLTLDWTPRAEAHLLVVATALLLALSYGLDAYFSRGPKRVFSRTATVVCLLFLGAEVEVAVTFLRSRVYFDAAPITIGVWIVPPIVGCCTRLLWDVIGAMLERMLKRK